MAEQSLPHNRCARADFTHHISTYTLRYTQLDYSSLNLAHVWVSFSHKVPCPILENPLWKTTSSESKGKLGISGKGLVTALALKTKARSKNTKGKVMPSEMSGKRTFPTLSNILKNWQGTLCEKDTQT